MASIDLRAAAQQALEALHEIGWSNNTRWQSDRAATVIPDLRAALAEDALQRFTDVNQELEAALAEPVQEPVACSNTFACRCPKHYTAPPQRLPLTEKEIEEAYREIWRDLPSDFDHTSSGWIEQGIKYAERAHGIVGVA